MVDLGNVDNTSDINKPVSTAQATSIATKVGLTGNETIAGDKTFSGTTAGITASMVGLSFVDNTSDANKPISTAQATAIANKVGLTGDETIAGDKTFSGTTAGITASMVGLSFVDNTSDANKPVSTAQATAIANKVGLTGNETIEGDKTFSGTTQFAEQVTLLADLSMNTDGSKISFGADGEITLTHEHNKGLIFKNTNTTANNPFTLTLQTGETEIVASDKIGVINFQAPGEASGTDANTIAAGIEAISETVFHANDNKTKLSFKTAASEEAVEKMSLSSGGVLTLNAGGIVIPDGGNIGSANDTDAIGISSVGVVSISATTTSTSKTTGALTVGGGVGIAENLNLGGKFLLDSGDLTIASGIITPTKTFHTLVAQTDTDPNDNLSAITAGTTGQILYLQATPGHVITVKSDQDPGLGVKILTNGGADRVLTGDNHSVIQLIYDGTYWAEVSYSAGHTPS